MTLNYDFDMFMSAPMGTDANDDTRRFGFDDGDQAPTRMVAMLRDPQTLAALQDASADVRTIVTQAGFSTARSPIAIAGGVQVGIHPAYRKRALHRLRAARLKDDGRTTGDSEGFYLPDFVAAVSASVMNADVVPSETFDKSEENTTINGQHVRSADSPFGSVSEDVQAVTAPDSATVRAHPTPGRPKLRKLHLTHPINAENEKSRTALTLAIALVAVVLSATALTRT